MATEFTYTTGQQLAIEKLAKFLATDPRDLPSPFFVISGSAGTGKTTIAQEIPAMVKNGRCIGAAPTHKAVGVLAKRLQGTECRTIHSALGLKPQMKNGERTLVRSKTYDPSVIDDVRVIILDEGSMVDKTLLKYASDDAMYNRRLYVVLGDQYQLYPVNSKESPCFELDLPDTQKACLTEIVRQAGDSPIIQTATVIRDAIIAGVAPEIVGGTAPDGSGVHLMKKAKWAACLNKITKDERFLEDPDFSRVIAYRNHQVLSHIQLVRSMLGEDTNLPFSPEDTLQANEAWVVGEDVIFNTGEEHRVKGIEEHRHPSYPELVGYQVYLEDFAALPVYVLDQLRCRELYQKQLEYLKNQAKAGNGWRPFYALQEYFADLRPVFGLTGHKSQGSTFTNVFVDVPDIYSNKTKSEADRCLYVAVTRASKNVFILT